MSIESKAAKLQHAMSIVTIGRWCCKDLATDFSHQPWTVNTMFVWTLLDDTSGYLTMPLASLLSSSKP